MSALPATFADDVIDQPLATQFEAFLDEHRRALHDCLDGLTEEQARRSLVPSRTTLLGLVKHATFVEKVWFDEAVTCRSRAEIGIPATPDESFVLDDDDTIATVQRPTARPARPPAGRRPPWGSTTCCAATGAARCRCAGSTCTCCASSPSTAGTPTSCASSCSPSRRSSAAGDQLDDRAGRCPALRRRQQRVDVEGALAHLQVDLHALDAGALLERRTSGRPISCLPT